MLIFCFTSLKELFSTGNGGDHVEMQHDFAVIDIDAKGLFIPLFTHLHGILLKDIVVTGKDLCLAHTIAIVKDLGVSKDIGWFSIDTSLKVFFHPMLFVKIDFAVKGIKVVILKESFSCLFCEIFILFDIIEMDDLGFFFKQERL